ncbi:hypothetical protein AVEN_69125-1 [Araneus ventricosus]|uniref:Uncharacterized protein n=1 Tax=Araneus ventricosus TaxID=182803 RepID=A0A4Y2HUL4_ARAVE|nr:hypothetical protein AVEN_69125-1 [Araneus ventricosus]
MESAITIHEKSRIPNRRFDSEEVNFQALIDTDRLPDEAKGASIVDIVHIVRLLFMILLRKVKSNLAPTVLIRFSFDAPKLDNPISTHLMRVADMKVKRILSFILRVLQTKDDILLDEGFNIQVITIQEEQEWSIISLNEYEFGVF